jgi:hypothetical protein
MQIRLFIGLIILNSVSFGQSLKDEIDNTYNFVPHTLSKSEKGLKTVLLDKFWNKIRSDTTNFLPELRDELNSSNHNPFFYYDGSILLLSSSKSFFDKKLAAKAISKCDLKDIDESEYVKTLNHLSNDGANVTKAAIKILYDTGYSFFIKEHYFTFTQVFCLAYMLVPGKAEFYIDTLISLFKTLDPVSQKSIIGTFWVAYTCKGDSFINSIKNDSTLNEDVRAYAIEIMDENKYQQIGDPDIASNDKLYEIRKKSLNQFSNEAVDELEHTTISLRENSKCQ